MNDFRSILKNIIKMDNKINDLSEYGVYKSSINRYDTGVFFIVKENNSKKLIICDDNSNVKNLFEGINEIVEGINIKVCYLNNNNAKELRKIFSFTAPKSLKDCDITVGLGDRLGLATQGHLKLLKEYKFFPVLAQQSIRELNLTGRTYKDVLDDATWAVFQEGYKDGYGADGDHLKTFEEIEMALDNGFTMLTLDCSEHIDNTIINMEKDEIDKLYSGIDLEKRKNYESKYLGKKKINGLDIEIDLESLKEIVLIYGKAIDFTEEVYKKYLNKNKDIVFELSIDETVMTTSLEAHFVTADELIYRGVEINNLAPRFCGEFQKGIDYIGDVEEFRKEFRGHCKIAEHFDYKISVHSGSDKFSIFEVVGQEAKGKYHLKTAGTNWLEAVRVIAKLSPKLYRKMHKFAVNNVNEARKYYHVGAKEENIKNIDTVEDDKLHEYMDKDDSRQYLHITYGLILNDKDKDDKYTFRDIIYNILNENEEDYGLGLKKHIGRHLDNLNVPKV
ncbi:MAG: tagaturonate epimerase family protein [Clostridiales bacterium]